MGAQRTVDQLSGFETFATSRGRTGCLYRIQLRQSRDVDCVFTLTSSCSTSVSRNTRGYFSHILTASCHSLYFPDIGFSYLCSFTLILCFSTRVPQGVLRSSAINCGIKIHFEITRKMWNILWNIAGIFDWQWAILEWSLSATSSPLCVCVCVCVCVCEACSSFHG